MDLRELREQAKLRIIDVAYHLNIAEGTVRNWEKGRSIIRIPVDQVAKLCNLYNCSVQELSEAMQQSRFKAADDRDTSAEDQD